MSKSEELHTELYHLHVHLLNIICVAKDKIKDEQIQHDLFHTAMSFNNVVINLKKASLLIDYEYYYD